MNFKTRALLALLLAGTLLVGATGCKKDDGDKPSQSDLSEADVYANPEQFITVPELSSVKLSNADLDKQMAEQILSIRKNNSYEDFKKVDDAAQMGDTVNIDYEGKAADESVTLDEQTLSGMKGKYDLILGSNSFIGEYYDKDGNVVTKGFEEQLVGMKAGETRDITVTFPDSYSSNPTLEGMKIIFTVTVHSVSRLTIDENCTATVGYLFSQTEDDTTALKDFKMIFMNAKFEIDYTAEPDTEATFNKVFKIADYRDLFIGANKYQEIEMTLTVPTEVEEKYQAYAGKDIQVTFYIESAVIVPEWNDEFVKEYTSEKYSDAASYEEALRQDLIGNEAYEALAKTVTVKSYPESVLNELKKNYLVRLIAQETSESVDELTEDDLKALVDEETYNSLLSQAQTYAQEDLKERLIWEYLIKLLDITLTDEEYAEKIETSYQEYAANYMYYYYYYYGVVFSNAEEMESYYGKETLEMQFKFNKIIDLLPDKITVTD